MLLLSCDIWCHLGLQIIIPTTSSNGRTSQPLWFVLRRLSGNRPSHQYVRLLHLPLTSQLPKESNIHPYQSSWETTVALGEWTDKGCACEISPTGQVWKVWSAWGQSLRLRDLFQDMSRRNSILPLLACRCTTILHAVLVCIRTLAVAV